MPLSFFGIPFGLLGLADCWLVAAGFGIADVTLGRVLVAVSIAVWAIVAVAWGRGLRAHHQTIGAQLADPVTGPFGSLAVITPMLAAADALYPVAHTAGAVVVDVLVVATVLLAGWFTGQWIYRPLALATVHPGYFLPSVAGGFVASASAALVGQHGLARVLFGLGLVSWIVLGSIVLGRLVLGPPLPSALTPTIAIEVAPAAVATFAAFVINGRHIDTTLQLLAGYGLLMVVAQVRLVPAYRRLSFVPGFWSFTFAWAAVAFAGLSWLGVTRPAGWRAESYCVLAVITAFIGAIALRTATALHQGRFLPPPPPPADTTTSGATPERPATLASR